MSGPKDSQRPGRMASRSGLEDTGDRGRPAGVVPVIHPGINRDEASEIPAAKLALWLIQATGHKEPGTKQKE
jgi:hypothetical protein